MDFAAVAKLQGQFSIDRLSKVLEQVQQRHPLLRVCIAADALRQPKLVETDDKLAVKCPIAIEPIDAPDCRDRVVKCEDCSSQEPSYPLTLSGRSIAC